MLKYERRRQLLIALGATPMLAAQGGLAQEGRTPEAGVDYTVLPNPQPTDTPGKIEVLDFFWYNCPHCYALLSDLEAWRKRQAADVAYKHIPCDFGEPTRELHSKIFYTLDILGRVEDMHVKVFDAFNLKHVPLSTRDAIADYMADNGMARDKWLAVFDSFAVAGRVKRGLSLATAYNIEGTPTMAVDGRFLTSPSIEHTHTAVGALGVMSYLVERCRAERPHKRA